MLIILVENYLEDQVSVSQLDQLSRPLLNSQSLAGLLLHFLSVVPNQGPLMQFEVLHFMVKFVVGDFPPRLFKGQ